MFGGSSDDGGHTAYAGSNYFGVMSMSNYGESRADEFESESLVSFGTQITSQERINKVFRAFRGTKIRSQSFNMN